MTSGQESSNRGLSAAPYSEIESLAGVFHPHAIEVQDFSYYALMIDVRSQAEYDDDHIPGAVHLMPPDPEAEFFAPGMANDPLPHGKVAEDDGVRLAIALVARAGRGTRIRARVHVRGRRATERLLAVSEIGRAHV